MPGVIELPAQKAKRWRELRLTRDALKSVHQWRAVVAWARYTEHPIPISLSEEGFDLIEALLTQRQIELE